MILNKLLTTAALMLTSIKGVLSAPQAGTPTFNSSCPYTTVFTTTYTGLIEAPGTTYPYTTTVVLTSVSYPLATSTETETYTFSGTVWEGSPTYTITTTDYTSTYTETFVYTNYYGEPPYPSGCS
ncbi:hypothetical protein AcW1_003280 [Taiwanofungus camphoratus]|nr:hypothetical protein AcV5_001537 [Antrodia cinnamomea]KAI0922471.1 hypothetical protein AcV7_005996 [Antrodia cinnamomea]KAI0942725.1 hypothetical protein AcW1_003280 [Antrodia cinnamomea]